MKIDIRIKQKGIFSDFVTYRDIEEPIINYEVSADTYRVSFYKTRKGIKRHYEFYIPNNDLSSLIIRRTV